MKTSTLTAIIFILLSVPAFAQDDLLDMLDAELKDEKRLVEATFKGTRLINGHSIETRKKHNLDFIISHRFGELSGGAYELYGLDQSNIRIGLDYALFDKLSLGIGRNSFEKTIDSYVKYRLLRQTQGGREMPLSVTVFSSIAITTLKDRMYDLTFNNRLAYTYQILLARKFTPSFSFQVMPSYVHFNVITPEQLTNDVYALGAGGRMKLSKRISFNAEYYYQFEALSEETFNSIAIGVDIETGGHVFQLQFTSSQAMIEKGFIAETTNDFFTGDIHFGFNVSRTFQLGEKRK